MNNNNNSKLLMKYSTEDQYLKGFLGDFYVRILPATSVSRGITIT